LRKGEKARVFYARQKNSFLNHRVALSRFCWELKDPNGVRKD